MLKIAEPTDIGLCPERLNLAYELLEQWAHEDQLPGAGLAVGRRERMVQPRVFGRLRPTLDSPAMPEDAIFLIASISKPITCTAVMMLVERGELTVGDKVTRFVPEFGKNGKNGVTVRHLMTHTSGLPDMLPDNTELRAAHAPLSRFIEGICELKLDFAPGRGVQYQSMGIAMLAEIVKRISGKECRDYLRDEVFEPLGMHDTSLGVPPGWHEGEQPKTARIAHVRISEEAAATDWNWNREYWWGFGAPWGGLMTTPADLARFCQMLLHRGELEGVRILSPATVRAMAANQLAAMPDVPEINRRCQPWGLGWRLNWPAHSANFGDLLSPATYGHWGATGTVTWIDPEQDAFMILFTTQPQEPDGRMLSRISNVVASALL
jgi:CubicO group peptidase (beta-lactamase class C family)